MVSQMTAFPMSWRGRNGSRYCGRARELGIRIKGGAEKLIFFTNMHFSNHSSLYSIP
jgi:hypothetical protein